MMLNRIRGFQEVPQEFKKHPNVATILPTRGSKHSAGYDIYSKEEVIIEPGKSHLFWADVCSYMQYGEVLELYVRSSIGIKKGLIMKNVVGIIDADYYANPNNYGNLGVCLINIGDEPQKIEVGERIAQGIFKPFLESDNGNTDEERLGGIGSTNK